VIVRLGDGGKHLAHFKREPTKQVLAAVEK